MPLNERKVNLFIVGAAKCGTTSLYNYLSEHPDVFMSSVKEPNFFSEINTKDKYILKDPEKNRKYATKVISKLEIYNSLYDGVENQKIIGEASPNYLLDTTVATKIYTYNQEAKIIILLKNPIERAYSHYLMNYNGGSEKEKDFVKAINQNYNEYDKFSHYIKLGLYYDQVKEYYNQFPSNQILIINTKDFLLETKKTLYLICDFLNLEKSFFHTFRLRKFNETWLPKNPIFHYFFVLFNYFNLGDFVLDKLNHKTRLFMKKTFFRKKKEVLQLSKEDENRIMKYFEESNEQLRTRFNIEF